MEESVDKLLLEIQELKMQVYALEEQNEALRKQLYDKKDGGEGLDNLMRLYEEGFHICPAHFGSYRNRDEGCLFCMSFIKKQNLTGN